MTSEKSKLFDAINLMVFNSCFSAEENQSIENPTKISPIFRKKKKFIIFN